MRAYDLIAAKRDGKELSAQELDALVQGYTKGEVPDYQMAAFLMAAYLKGLGKAETASLTASMAASGDRADLSGIAGFKVDKHSTGGVGDKTTLVVAPIAAACGAKVAKMSGRGLGHTGGTVDKLEAIPGFCTVLSPAAFAAQVNRIGIAVVGQSGNLAPADKKIYALRDVTATVSSLPLIASSIMSKKLAAGADGVVLDVKYGSGAFMKTAEEAIALAKEMVDIGEANGLATKALISGMEQPLGLGIGNSIEVAEAVEVLLGRGPDDLVEVCIRLAALMLELAGHRDGEALARGAIADGTAYEKLCEMVAAQGGDVAVLQDTALFPQAAVRREVKAPRGGYIGDMDTERIGMASVVLGAGRATKEDTIDPAAGLVLCKKRGDTVQAGEALAVLHTASGAKAMEAEAMLLTAIGIQDTPPGAVPLLYAVVDKNGIELL